MVDDDNNNTTITCCVPLLLAPIAGSGNYVYVVWWDDKTENWEVFFARSTDNGRTFEQPLNLSNNTGRSENAQIFALEENVYVTWWTIRLAQGRSYLEQVQITETVLVKQLF
jgi:hypothetical protein